MPCSPHQQASCFSAYFVSPLLEAGCCLPVVPLSDLVWQVGCSLQGVAALPRKAKLLAKYEDHTVLSSVDVAPNSKTFLYPSTDSLVTLFMKSWLQTYFVHYRFVFLPGVTSSVTVFVDKDAI